MVQIFKTENFQNLTTIVYCHFFFFLLIIDLYENQRHNYLKWGKYCVSACDEKDRVKWFIKKDSTYFLLIFSCLPLNSEFWIKAIISGNNLFEKDLQRVGKLIMILTSSCEWSDCRSYCKYSQERHYYFVDLFSGNISHATWKS